MLGSPPPEEAAVVVAAVERFLAETAPAPAPARSTEPWQRAALLEGIRAKEGFASPWGESQTWGVRHSHRP
jgi:hypothetical protein